MLDFPKNNLPRLHFAARHIFNVKCPSLRRAAPDLTGWGELFFLVDRAEPNVEHPLADIIDRGRIDVRAAFGAKGLDARRAAIGGFNVILGRVAQQREVCLLGWDNSPVRTGRHFLTIGTVTNHYRILINLGLISYMTAMAAAVNFHPLYPLSQVSFTRPWTSGPLTS